MLAAVAEKERDFLVERTQAGLQKAKAEGKTLCFHDQSLRRATYKGRQFPTWIKEGATFALRPYI